MTRAFANLARRGVRLARHVTRDSTRGVTPGHVVEDLRRFLRQGRRGAILSWPRHPLRLYEETLVRLLASDGCRVLSLETHVRRTWAERNAIGLVLRHDVDAGDLRSTAALCEIEARLNVASSVHMLVDDAIYPAKSM